MIGECPRTPEARRGCPLAPRCHSNEHHIFWPRLLYKTQVERAFRELPENKEQKCVWEHNELHEFEPPPEKPAIEDMLAALSRVALEREGYDQAA